MGTGTLGKIRGVDVMRRMLSVLALLMMVATSVSGDALIDYPLEASPVTTDQLLLIDDPAGTWETNRVAISVLLALVDKLLEGDSFVEVTDAGTGEVEIGRAHV